MSKIVLVTLHSYFKPGGLESLPSSSSLIDGILREQNVDRFFLADGLADDSLMNAYAPSFEHGAFASWDIKYTENELNSFWETHQGQPVARVN